ncbi:MAG: protein kinase, partial [Candidatus Krumholzibacteriia bacterium]
MLGPYRLAAQLGVGGMGEVYRARDTKLDRDVAIKILPEAVTADPDRHARFHREARAMAAFNHPHVAAVHALGEHEGRHYLVMELVAGESLAQTLARGPLPVDRALHLARQMAAGIEAAHGAGIVHRDLKPANVMLTPDGDAKILDFGLAKVFAEDSEERTGLDDPTLTTDRTRAGVVLGTAAYMSPEQARGLAVDKRTDVWAFGVVLFEMVSGRRPFGGATVTDTLAAVLRAEPPWDALPRDLPAPVGRLIQRCLQKDPRRRLHDAADARIVLEDLGAPDGPYAPSSPLRGLAEAGDRAPRATGRRAAWPAVAVAVAACAVAAWALWLRPEAPAQPPRARSLTFSGRDWAPSVSPDGALVAFTSDRDGVSRIWLKQLAGGGEAPLTAGPDDMARFSPDGAQVLFVRDAEGSRDLHRVPVLGGQPRRVVGDATEGDWSPDGQRVAFLRAHNEDGNTIQKLTIASLQSGEERILHTGRNVLLYGIRWSPDGRLIAVNSAPLTGNVAQAAYVLMVDAQDGSVRELAVQGRQLACGAVAWAPGSDALAVGQPTDLLSHVLGYPGLVLETRIDGTGVRPVAWLPIRLPRGGWGTSTLAVLDRGRFVMDEAVTMAGLREVTLDASGRPGGERILTRGLSRDRQPVYAPDGRTVLFSSNRSGNVDLWTVDRASGSRAPSDSPAPGRRGCPGVPPLPQGGLHRWAGCPATRWARNRGRLQW